jgi:hypothetical protein
MTSYSLVGPPLQFCQDMTTIMRSLFHKTPKKYNKMSRLAGTPNSQRIK